MEEKSNSKTPNRLIWLLVGLLGLVVVAQSVWLFNLSGDVDLLKSTQQSQALAEVKQEPAKPRRLAKVDDLDKINSLMAEGKYEEALEEHLWYHEASRFSPSLAGVRASFALSYWIDLGKRYPPAHDALIELRDKYQKIVLSGEGGYAETSDLFAIHRALYDTESALEDFRQLLKISPKDAKNVYLFVEDLLIEEKAFDIVSQFLSDPLLKYEELRLRRESNLSYAKDLDETARTTFLRTLDEAFVSGVTQLIKTLLEIDRPEEAKTIQERALEYHPSDTISDSLND